MCCSGHRNVARDKCHFSPVGRSSGGTRLELRHHMVAWTQGGNFPVHMSGEEKATWLQGWTCLIPYWLVAGATFSDVEPEDRRNMCIGSWSRAWHRVGAPWVVDRSRVIQWRHGNIGDVPSLHLQKGHTALYPSARRKHLAESSPVPGSETLRDSLSAVPHKRSGHAKYIIRNRAEIRASWARP